MPVKYDNPYNRVEFDPERSQWIVLVALLLLSLFAAPGCASMLSAGPVEVYAQSVDSDSTLSVNGRVVSTLPTTLYLDNTEPVTLSATCSDGTVDTQQIDTYVRGVWVAIDILAAGLLGVIVDAVTGEWRTLDVPPMLTFCSAPVVEPEPEPEPEPVDEPVGDELRIGGRR